MLKLTRTILSKFFFYIKKKFIQSKIVKSFVFM